MILEQSEFKSWLLKKQPDESIGIVGSAESCPIARYLTEKTGKQAIVKSHRAIHVNLSVGDIIPWRMIDPPMWMSRFIAKVDSPENGPSISAKEALQFLEEMGR